ncbi:MAG: hypothetical protein KF705_09770 [Phycisphaeraceae bacterium]|nr:hypothetical protein [Phycisphaeraceae bacterium]
MSEHAGITSGRASGTARARSHAPFVAALLVLSLLAFGGIAAFNVAVDPFRAFRTEFSEKRFASAWVGTRRVSKGEVLRHSECRVLLLGTSRVERGFDPAHPGFGGVAGGGCNMGLGATNLWEGLRVFRYAVRHEPLEHVVLGLDMLMFNANRQFEWDFRQSIFNESRRYPDYRLGTLLSRYAIDSSRKVIERSRMSVTDANDDRGFLARGVHTGFDYRGESVKLLRGFMTNPKSYGPYVDDGSRWAMLDEILRTCRERGIRLTIVLPPSHALDMEMLWVSGNWGAFEAWKRRIVEMVDAENARALAGDVGAWRVPVWDFTTHAGRNAEELPRRGEGEPWRAMRDWLETSHFTKEYGDDVIARMTGVQRGGREEPGEDLGVLITGQNIEAHLARLRSDRGWFVRAFPADARMVRNLWEQAKKSRRENVREAGG